MSPVKPIDLTPVKSFSNDLAWFPPAMQLVLVIAAALLIVLAAAWLVIEIRDEQRARRSAAVLANLNRPARAAVLERHL